MRERRWLRRWSLAGLACFVFAAQTVWSQESRAHHLAATGWQALEAGRLSEARSALLEATKLEPGNPVYAMALGQVYLSLENPKLAISELRRALNRLPADFDIRYTLAQAYQSTDKDSEALKLLEGAPPSEPLRGPWIFSRGFSLFRLGRLDPAESLFRKLLPDERMRAPAHFFVANCQFARAQYERSLPYYEKAIAFGNVPDNKALNAFYYNQGLALFQLQRFGEAARALRNSIQRYSKDPLPWLFLGRCEAELGRYSEAIEALEASIKEGPELRMACFQLARLHARQGNQQRSDELFQKVEKLRKDELQEEEALARRLKLTSR